jgi:hypothetical protein
LAFSSLSAAWESGSHFGLVSVLKRLLKKIRRRLGKKLDIEIRSDSGFVTPALYEFL